MENRRFVKTVGLRIRLKEHATQKVARMFTMPVTA